VLALLIAAGGVFAADRDDLTRVVVPDDKPAALQALAEWIKARGFEVQPRKELLVMRREGVLMNLIPIVNEGELDRIRVVAFYYAKDQYKGSKEFEQLAVKLNKSQNFLQVFVTDDGELAAASNLTFFDELSARVFDAFVDAFAQITKRYVLTDEAVTMLK
jgi:hypothetical protein